MPKRNRLLIQAVIVLGLGTLTLAVPPRAAASSFDLCRFCAGGDATCQEWFAQWMCNQICDGWQLVSCHYDPEPFCAWDEVEITCQGQS
jgi:hypothetical protein